MPPIESWRGLPVGIREHLIERMRDRDISIADLNQLRYGWSINPLYRKGHGTRTSVLSNCAAQASIRRRFCWRGKWLLDRGYRAFLRACWLNDPSFCACSTRRSRSLGWGEEFGYFAQALGHSAGG